MKARLESQIPTASCVCQKKSKRYTRIYVCIHIYIYIYIYIYRERERVREIQDNHKLTNLIH